jgi:hypothetical protein
MKYSSVLCYKFGKNMIEKNVKCIEYNEYIKYNMTEKALKELCLREYL